MQAGRQAHALLLHASICSMVFSWHASMVVMLGCAHPKSTHAFYTVQLSRQGADRPTKTDSTLLLVVAYRSAVLFLLPTMTARCIIVAETNTMPIFRTVSNYSPIHHPPSRSRSLPQHFVDLANDNPYEGITADQEAHLQVRPTTSSDSIKYSSTWYPPAC
jgi:hypothetical protein